MQICPICRVFYRKVKTNPNGVPDQKSKFFEKEEQLKNRNRERKNRKKICLKSK